MIAVPLFVTKDGEQRNWGTFRFEQLPSPGDHINITDRRDRVQQLTVSYVAHEPLREDQPEIADRMNAFVHAEWVGEYY